MNTSTRPLRARFAAPRALLSALQWRLLLLWIVTSLLCALVGTLPLWSWLGSQFDYSLQAPAIAAGKAPVMILDALTAPNNPLPVIGNNIRNVAILTLLLSPLLAGATITASRSKTAIGFGDLLRGGISEYGPMLRLLIWSVLPLGVAAGVMVMLMGFNEKIHEHAILASDISSGRNLAFVVGGLLLLLMHAGIEAGRGWLAADARLRSALKAWGRGMLLLLGRPLAVLWAYLLPTLCSLLLALAFIALRGHINPSGMGGFLLGLLLACAISGALAWGKVARLYAMRALAEDAHGRRR